MGPGRKVRLPILLLSQCFIVLPTALSQGIIFPVPTSASNLLDPAMPILYDLQEASRLLYACWTQSRSKRPLINDPALLTDDTIQPYW